MLRYDFGNAYKARDVNDIWHSCWLDKGTTMLSGDLGQRADKPCFTADCLSTACSAELPRVPASCNASTPANSTNKWPHSPSEPTAKSTNWNGNSGLSLKTHNTWHMERVKRETNHKVSQLRITKTKRTSSLFQSVICYKEQLQRRWHAKDPTHPPHSSPGLTPLSPNRLANRTQGGTQDYFPN